MNINVPKGGHCCRRKIKRARYNVSFEQRYGMPRSKWVEYKRTHTKAEVHAKREKARR